MKMRKIDGFLYLPMSIAAAGGYAAMLPALMGIILKHASDVLRFDLF